MHESHLSLSNVILYALDSDDIPVHAVPVGAGKKAAAEKAPAKKAASKSKAAPKKRSGKRGVSVLSRRQGTGPMLAGRGWQSLSTKYNHTYLAMRIV